MNYLLFANPHTGSPIISKLIKDIPPKVVVTNFIDIDSWKRILCRLITNKFTVEDKLRYYYKINFYDYKSLDTNSLKKIIDRNKIEIGFITTFSHIIPKELFDLFPKGLYNFHPSLLPIHGGANPIFWVLYLGDEYTGTTCHRVTDVLDHGDIIMQTKYPVNKMDAKELFNCYVKDINGIIQKMTGNNIFYNSRTMGVTEYDPPKIPRIDITDKNLNREIISRYKRAMKSFI